MINREDPKTERAMRDRMNGWRRNARGEVTHMNGHAVGKWGAAERCGRVAVSARWLWEHPDITAYIYSEGADDFNLDPWTVVTGVDALVDGSKIILETGRVGERAVDPDYEVFVSKRDAERSDD